MNNTLTFIRLQKIYKKMESKQDFFDFLKKHNIPRKATGVLVDQKGEIRGSR